MANLTRNIRGYGRILFEECTIIKFKLFSHCGFFAVEVFPPDTNIFKAMAMVKDQYGKDCLIYDWYTPTDSMESKHEMYGIGLDRIFEDIKPNNIYINYTLKN